jgi:hypothetical protein
MTNEGSRSDIPVHVGVEPGAAWCVRLDDGRFHVVRAGRMGNLFDGGGDILASEALAGVLRETCSHCVEFRRTELVQVATGERFGTFYEICPREEVTPDLIGKVDATGLHAWRFGRAHLFVSPKVAEGIQKEAFADLVFSPGFSAFGGGSSNKYNPERDVTPNFLETVGRWIDASSEVFVVLRYLYGMRDYALIKSREEFAVLVESVSVGTDILVFRDAQLQLRGRVTPEFIARAKALIRRGEEYILVKLASERSGVLTLPGKMGETNAELLEDLSEEMGEEVAVGACPNFMERDNDGMVSASKGGIDGPR